MTHFLKTVYQVLQKGGDRKDSAFNQFRKKNQRLSKAYAKALYDSIDLGNGSVAYMLLDSIEFDKKQKLFFLESGEKYRFKGDFLHYALTKDSTSCITTLLKEYYHIYIGFANKSRPGLSTRSMSTLRKYTALCDSIGDVIISTYQWHKDNFDEKNLTDDFDALTESLKSHTVRLNKFWYLKTFCFYSKINSFYEKCSAEYTNAIITKEVSYTSDSPEYDYDSYYTEMGYVLNDDVLIDYFLKGDDEDCVKLAKNLDSDYNISVDISEYATMSNTKTYHKFSQFFLGQEFMYYCNENKPKQTRGLKGLLHDAGKTMLAKKIECVLSKLELSIARHKLSNCKLSHAMCSDDYQQMRKLLQKGANPNNTCKEDVYAENKGNTSRFEMCFKMAPNFRAFEILVDHGMKYETSENRIYDFFKFLDKCDHLSCTSITTEELINYANKLLQYLGNFDGLNLSAELQKGVKDQKIVHVNNTTALILCHMANVMWSVDITCLDKGVEFLIGRTGKTCDRLCDFFNPDFMEIVALVSKKNDVQNDVYKNTYQDLMEF